MISLWWLPPKWVLYKALHHQFTTLASHGTKLDSRITLTAFGLGVKQQNKTVEKFETISTTQFLIIESRKLLT